MPGMKLSCPSVVAPIGSRTGALQVTPSVVVLITMSLPAQLVRKRQSCQTTYTRPAASTSAEGSGPLRTLPASRCASVAVTRTVLRQLAPPSSERKEMIADSDAFVAGMTTAPLGCTTGGPPRAVALLPVFEAELQVRPPLVDVDTFSRSPSEESSNVV